MCCKQSKLSTLSGLRFSDVSSDVRTECVKHSKYYLAYHPDLSGDVSGKSFTTSCCVHSNCIEISCLK